MLHTIVGPTLANCEETVGYWSEMSALPIVPQLTICEQMPPIGPLRIYCPCVNLLPPNNGQQNYSLLVQQRFKIIEPSLVHY